MDETNEFSFILKPSRDKGVGIFATHDISKGTVLLISPKNYKGRVIKKEDFNAENKRLIDNFCLFREDHAICPEDFNRPYIMWYINHGEEPNAELIDDTWYAIRDIKEGEELLCDYNGFGEPEDVKEWYYKR